ncbi:hypothetical protein [Leptothoe kymatousa]|uniref:Carboxypeptidase regulatory-like domain-containing protein n=1 Tax=Leptothoe kymatousa TAU-MAC 1615 TaxID=2364775 RepID=A0ABS5Y817_9CYAN|nr:hypothetical protein [Leptothoe kymatousa]MBT9313648.1 carboxypeptidase regulatory-like domain-containing protein [Leptothoe kymatousa TAU-MAC 1615]
MKSISGAWLLLILITTVGCIPYPIEKKLQPETKATILDEKNKPVEGAQVSLIASSYPNGIAQGYELKFTNNEGLVQFDSKYQWRIELLRLNGAEIFFWNWCVYKTGYETYMTTYRSADDWQDAFTVRLKPGATSECNYQQ